MNLTGSIKLMRPKQWIKNLFVFAALIFSGNFIEIDLVLIATKTFLLFCLISSTIYILNDLVDIEKDKLHPEKKFRPLASGNVSKFNAILLAIILLIIVFIFSYTNKALYYILFAYLVLNILYSFVLKNIVILDVMTITTGFVLRLSAGSVTTKIPVSPWLILCTILLSLFLALNKRKSELITLKTNSVNHRKILEEYSLELINNMLSIVTPSILIAYCLYTFNSVQNQNMMFTIPFVLYGIFRYQYLVVAKNLGGKPEDIFTKDIPFLINILLWVACVIVIIYT